MPIPDEFITFMLAFMAPMPPMPFMGPNMPFILPTPMLTLLVNCAGLTMAPAAEGFAAYVECWNFWG